MTSNLLPCPFCGGKATRITLQDEENFGGDVIICQNCDACSRVVFGEKEGLVETWNRRATQAAAGEPVATLMLRRSIGSCSVGVVRFDADQLADGALVDVYAAPPAAAHGDGLSFSTVAELAAAIRQVSAYEDLGPELIAEEMFKQSGAAHGDEAVRKVQTMGYASVTEALADLEKINTRFAQPTDGYDPDAALSAQGDGEVQ